MTATRPVRRRGAILLVVLALLALFAVIGLSFVLYAESAGTSGRVYRESKSKKDFLDKERLTAQAISQLVYGTYDVNSAARGHDLARLMYGEAGGTQYNGVGLYHETLTITGSGMTVPGTDKIDRADVVNYTPFTISTTDFVVDPEYTKGDGTVRQNAAGAGSAVRTTTGQPLSSLLQSSYIYVAKNAPYTYPDRNNLLVGLMDPSTGQVVVPSAHRSSLFRIQPDGTQFTTTKSDLDQTNPNWTNPSGRLKILRPRPFDHGGASSLFPYPPPNADGSITGDVQNLKFAGGVQRNDSVWLDLNLPVQDYKGRRLVPLVAPLLLALDGKINLNAAGNLKGMANHVSNMGFGPHEINIAAVLGGGTAQTDANTITQTKYNAPSTPALPWSPSATTRAFSTVPPSAASQVDWGGTAAANWLALPGSTAAPNGLTSAPTYSLPNAATDPNNHPTLWAPSRRAQYASSDPNQTLAPPPAEYGKGFPLTDLRLFAGKYSGKSMDYSTQAYLSNSNRVLSFQNQFANGGVPSTAKTRALVTPFSASLAQSGLAPNWFGVSSSSTVYNSLFTYQAGQAGPIRTDPMTGAPSNTQLNIKEIANLTNSGPNQPSVQGDEQQRPGQPRVQNLRAALGAVNLNRPLADYRTDTTQPLAAAANALSAGSQQYLTATLDRQKLAEDVFIRLAVATGARVAFDTQLPAQTRYTVRGPDTAGKYAGYVLPQPTGTLGTYTLTVNGTQLTPAPTQQEYDALRWLAQLAANVVDAVDSDDISTPFVWNPDPAQTTFTAVTDAQYTGAFAATGTPPALGMRVVFGTEKPRLVVNEGYAEVANDKADKSGPKANKDYRVRFWFELLNPSPTEAAGTILAGPDGAGAVPLVNSAGPPASVYRLQVFDKASPVLQQLQRPRNVTGAVDAQDATVLPSETTAPLTGSKITTTATTPDAANRLDCDLTTGVTPAPGMPPTTYVEANNGVGSASMSRSGFCVVGPNVNKGNASDSVAFTPDDGAGNPFSFTLYKAENTGSTAATDPNALDYFVTKQPKAQIKSQAVDPLNADPNRHVVLLRRLANPYLPANDPLNTSTYNSGLAPNPYLTVDVLSQVQVFDGVKYGSDPTPPATNTDSEATDASKRNSFGRVQPYAGYQDFVVAGGTPQYQYPTSATPTLTLKQLGAVNGTAVGGKNPGMSFFQHNSQNVPPPTPMPANDPANGGTDKTILTPFEWLVHFDRPLVNQLELLHATALPPHQLTRNFLRPVPNSATLVKHAHDLQHRDPSTTAAMTAPYFPNDGPLFQRDANQAFTSPLYRALDLLQTKPWTSGVPAGGRQSGKVNINMVWDGDASGSNPSQVFRAVLDSQAGNGFSAADVNTLWQAVVKSRSPQWAVGGTGTVGPTADELGASPAATVTSFDRPFKGFGAGLFSASAPYTANPTTAGVAYPTGGTFQTQFQAQPPGLEDTLLRRKVSPTVSPDPAQYASQLPFLFQNPAAVNATAGTNVHPYQQWEPLRKAFNSLTTTTDSYLLLVTVGFFEVDETGGGRVLRQEAYDDSPGDLRAQFAAVIDRTGLTAPVAAGQPFAQSVSAAGFVNPTDTAPWALELTGPLQVSTSSGGYPATRLAVPPPTTGTVSGTADTDTSYSGFNQITPVAAGTKNTVEVADQPNGTRFLYDGQPLTLTASYDTSTMPATYSGTRFFVGSGDARELVEAYMDANSPWYYNSTSGELKLCVRVVDPTTGLATGTQRYAHVAGEAMTNANFGNPGPQAYKTYKAGQADGVVRMFLEVK